jgi:ABC-2 type transport system permease protein
MRVAFNEQATDPAFAVLFENEAKVPLFATSTEWVKGPTGRYGPGDEAIFSVSLDNQFAPGRLYASPWVVRRGQDLMDRRPRFTSVIVTGGRRPQADRPRRGGADVSATSPAEAAFGRRIRGPSALGGDWGRFLHLTWTLAVTEFKLRFFGSVLGYLWQLMRPLMLFGVLYLVFTEFVRIGQGVAHFPVVLLLGIVLFTFFAEATGGAVSSLVDRENMVRKIHFPRMVIPLAVVLTAYFNLLLNLVVVAIFLLAFGVEPAWTWLLLPVVLALLIAITTAVSMIVSSLYPRFRDLAMIWTVLVTVLFYASPVLYPLEKVPGTLQDLILLNPLAVLLELARVWIVDPTAPTPSELTGGAAGLLPACAIFALVCGVAVWVFRREAPRIAEEL